MSIENQLSALTDAINALARAVAKPIAQEPITAEVVTPKPRKAAVASPQPATVDASPVSPPVATYEDVKAALMAVNDKHGRDLAVACLTKFGALRTPDILPAQYAEALVVFNFALGSGHV